MFLYRIDAGRIGATSRDDRRPARAGLATVPGAASRGSASLIDRWHALLRKLHEINCLPALGGCPEELIDSHGAQDTAIADRW